MVAVVLKDIVITMRIACLQRVQEVSVMGEGAYVHVFCTRYSFTGHVTEFEDVQLLMRLIHVMSDRLR